MLQNVHLDLPSILLKCGHTIGAMIITLITGGARARERDDGTKPHAPLPRRSCVTQHTHRKLRMCCVFPLLVASMNVTAQDKEEVHTELIAEVRVESMDASNRRTARFVPATVLSQGEVVYYTLRIRNPSTVYLRDVVVTQRIPANTVYVDGSASAPGADVSFSVDGGQNFAPSGQLRTVDASGAAQPATPEQYTHIRFRLRNALAPGAVALARFRAVFQ